MRVKKLMQAHVIHVALHASAWRSQLLYVIVITLALHAKRMALTIALQSVWRSQLFCKALGAENCPAKRMALMCMHMLTARVVCVAVERPQGLPSHAGLAITRSVWIEKKANE